MAKGDVTLKFDAQTATFVQAIMQAREKLEAAADSARKFGKDSAKAGDEAHEGFKKAGEAAKELAISIVGISSATDLMEKAVDLAKEGVEQYFERMTEKAEKFLRSVEGINSALGASGQATQAPGVRAALDKITVAGGRITSPQEKTADYAAISRALGNRASASVKLEATNVAEIGRAANMDDEAAQQLGINFAQLARERRPGGAFENYTNEQLQDLAYKVTVNLPGGLSDKDLRFFSQSRDKDQALGLLFAAAQSDESSKGLLALQNASEQEIDPVKVAELQKLKHQHPRKFAAEDERILRLSAIAPEDRMSAMLNDATLAPADSRLAIKSLREGARRIPATRGLNEEIEALEAGQDEPGRLADLGANIKNQIAQDATTNAVREARRKIRKDAIFRRIRKQNDYLPDFLLNWESNLAVSDHPWLWNVLVGDVGTPVRNMDPKYGLVNDELSGQLREEFPARNGQGGGGEAHAEMKKQTKHLEAISAQLGEQTSQGHDTRHTTLSFGADKPGAQ